MSYDNVVAAIIKKDNLYFIAQRNRNKHLGLKWEFPGGKVHANETFKEALIREIKEELNIEVDLHSKLTEEKYRDNEINIILHYYICSIKSGIIKLNEHENFAWVESKDFNKYEFAEGDGDILSLLN
ncbi:MAG: CTP pyrophosphohydrolase [Alphaproteobacteria bacterium MarineAlpha5_Bin11]|nr:NUDIX hydrolase [Pelagibacteraceae bacterium]PPR44093.1 MAG: CTP pyrophosphohydrolase [Alphaproteobacteria bacterium MarineAlpha5_Bin11]PPR51594.1 MAG: CTP pyrophosphohydrolase [Alphaproteobacteria bacterium MarineAlpha5_Bin10]|tara:strand:- start:476 stop:856 length:381 start_codon:yes stop_codon:yes gene_type:complete